MKKIIFSTIFVIISAPFVLVGYQASSAPAQKEDMQRKEVESQVVAARQKRSENRNYVEGEVIVKFKQKNFNLQALRGQNEILSFAQKRGMEIKNNIKPLNASLLKSNTKSTDELIAELKQDPAVEYAEPNFIYHQLSVPNDPYFSNQWGLHNTGQAVNSISGTSDADIDMPEAWDYLAGKDTSEVIVAIIDGGVDLDHPDLSSQFLPGYDFADGDSTPQDLDGHGTHIAGIIGGVADNNQGVAGFNSKIKIIPLRVFDASGNTTNTKITLAIYEAYDKKAKIVNMSLGGLDYSQSMYDAMSFGKSLYDTLFVVAAGNSSSNNNDTPTYPASYDLDNIISVAATDQNDNLAAFSNYGLSSVDVAAPGVNIYSAYPHFVELFSEDFESSIPAALPSTFYNPNSWDHWNTYEIAGYTFVRPTNVYLNNDLSSMALSSPIDISLYKNTILKFNMIADIEMGPASGYCFDALFLEVDNNDNNWQIKNSLCGYYGFSDVIEDITSTKNNFRVKFTWFTDSTNLPSFFNSSPMPPYIDYVKVLGIDSTGSYEFLQGTSMATPYVTGLAATLKSLKPDLTYKQIKDLIINNADKKDQLNLKILWGRRINAYSTLLHSDTSAPISSVSSNPLAPDGDNSYYRTAPIITLSATDEGGSGLAKSYYKWDSNSYAEYSAPFGAPEGIHTLYYYSTDNAGNAEQEKSSIFKTDTIKPTASYTLSPEKSDGDISEQYKTVPTINLSGQDDGSGIASVYCKWGANAYIACANQFKGYDGLNTLYFYPKDLAGNIGDEASFTVNVDSTPPSEVPTFTSYGRVGLNYIALSTTGPHKDPEPRFEWTQATDGGSGVKGYYVLWTTDKNANAATGIFQTDLSFTAPRINSKGMYYLLIKTVDNNGNVSAGTYLPYNADPDLISPVAQIKNSIKAVKGKYYSSKMAITITSTDANGSPTVYYHWDDEPYSVLRGKTIKARAGRHTLYYYAADQYGNKADEKRVVYNVVLAPYESVFLTQSLSPKQNDLQKSLSTFKVMNIKEIKAKPVRFVYSFNAKEAKEKGAIYINKKKISPNKLTIANYDKKLKKWTPIKTAVSRTLKFVEAKSDKIEKDALFGVFVKN